MELPKMSRGNNYVVVFQKFLSKFPLVFPVPDQKTEKLLNHLLNKWYPCLVCPRHYFLIEGPIFCHNC